MPAQALKLKTTCGSLGLAWNVLSSHDLPGGALVWLHITPSADELASAATARELVIAETGVVASLRVRNPCARDVLLPSDVIVDGGKQARVVERSVIVKASSQVEIPVRCVEAGRWRARDAGTAERFQVTSTASGATREHIAQLKQRSLRRHKRFDLDQSDVWTHVSSELDREDLTSATSSYTAVLGKRQRQVERAKAIAVRVPPDANGVAVVRRRGATWVEAFPTRDHVEAAVTSMIADLLDEHASSDAPGDGVAASRTESALATLWSAAVLAMDIPEGTSGEAFAIDADGVAGSLLMRDARLAHLAVRVAH